MRMRKMLKARKIEIEREGERKRGFIYEGVVLYGGCVGGGEGGVDSSYLCFVRLRL